MDLKQSVKDKKQEVKECMEIFIKDLLKKELEEEDYYAMQITLNLRMKYNSAVEEIMEKWDDEANPLN